MRDDPSHYGAFGAVVVAIALLPIALLIILLVRGCAAQEAAFRNGNGERERHPWASSTLATLWERDGGRDRTNLLPVPVRGEPKWINGSKFPLSEAVRQVRERIQKAWLRTAKTPAAGNLISGSSASRSKLTPESATVLGWKPLKSAWTQPLSGFREVT